MKKILIALISETPAYNRAPSSRALYLFENLIKCFPNTYLIMQKDENCITERNHLIQISAIVPIKGRYQIIKKIFFIIQANFEILSLTTNRKINVIVIRGNELAFLFPIFRILKIKTFYDFHGLASIEYYNQKLLFRGFISKFIEIIILKFTNKVIVTSEGFKSQIKKYGEKCIQLPNGVDLEKINGNNSSLINISPKKQIIGFIGNWEHDMRIQDICESLNFLDNCIVLIIGEGKNYERFVEQYSNNNNILFTGRIDTHEVYGLLKEFDICIIPYDKDSLRSKITGLHCARKTIEYLAAGKPIIVSNVAAKENFLIINENCLVYESRNPEDLAEKIKILLNDKSLYNRLSKNNQELGIKFSWDSLIKKSGLIEEIIETP